MDIVVSYLTGILANISTELAKKVISDLKSSKIPSEKIEAITNAKNVIELAASNGTISLKGTSKQLLLEALRSIRCDHDTGEVSIDQVKLKAPVLFTGGLESNSTGSTVITESELESNGTKVSVPLGGSITFTGNASMHQS